MFKGPKILKKVTKELSVSIETLHVDSIRVYRVGLHGGVKDCEFNFGSVNDLTMFIDGVNAHHLVTTGKKIVFPEIPTGRVRL